MRQINVLTSIIIGGEKEKQQCLKLIADINPDITVKEISQLMSAENEGDRAAEEQLDALLAEVEVYCGFRPQKNLISRAPKLKWIQAMSAGVERMLTDDIRESAVVMTNVSGIHAIPIAEFVIGTMLMFVKHSPLYFQLKSEKKWERIRTGILNSKTLGIVGLGSLGREIARLSKAFDMKVLATRRSAKEVGQAENVDVVFPLKQLHEMLGESDFVVLSLPLTAESRGLIGEAELRAMKSSAYLINIARGGVIDEEVLIRALEEKWITGAGLDVFAKEPLSPDSKLWELPNVIFSPHVSGGMENYVSLATEVFCQNLKRYLNGEELLHIVDKKAGY